MCRSILAVISLSILTSLSGAQDFSFSGSPLDRFGFAVDVVGDVNGDGRLDFIVGALQDITSSDPGYATVYSGLDGSMLYNFVGDDAEDYFGIAVSDAGDVNGDGFVDLIVGAAGDDDNGADSGSARIFSGMDGSILYTLLGDNAGDFFGRAVSGAGDVNGDGFADVIVGATGDDGNGQDSGSAQIFSGLDGSMLYSFAGNNAGDNFGARVHTAGDVNNDGSADVIVTGYGTGVYVFSGANGSLLHTFTVVSGVDHSADMAGDINNDGHDDVVVGVSFFGMGGGVFVYSGADGTILLSITGAPGNTIGSDVSGAGDVDGDGTDDLAIINNGNAQVYSGANGSLLYNFVSAGSKISGRDGVILVGSPGANSQSGSARVLLGHKQYETRTFVGNAGDRMGQSVAVVGDTTSGDVNGDGVVDFVVGSPGHSVNGMTVGLVQVFSGADGSLLHGWTGPVNSEFGYAVNGAGDVDGDGRADLIVGARADSSVGLFGSGSARVYSGADGSLMYQFGGSGLLDEFGSAVASAGDVNADGHDDLIVGATESGAQVGTGYVKVYSGFDGSVLYTLLGTSIGASFGHSVDGIGDINDDGHADFIIGAPGSGDVKVYSGADGSVVYSFSDDNYFGHSVSGAGDVNADGTPDFVTSIFTADDGGLIDAGLVVVISGLDGSILHVIPGTFDLEYLGYVVSGAGDINGDGHDDFLAAAVGGNYGAVTDAGSVQIFSGSDGSKLLTIHGDASNLTSYPLAADGYGGTIIYGQPVDDVGGMDAGSARVFFEPAMVPATLGGGQPNSQAATLLINDEWRGYKPGPFVSEVSAGEVLTIDVYGAPFAFFDIYGSALLNPAVANYGGFGLFDLGSAPGSSDVYYVVNGFAGTFPFYLTDNTGQFHIMTVLPPFLSSGPLINMQMLIQNAPPIVNGVWSTISAAHRLVVK